MSNTDNADPRTVLEQAKICASSWVPDARLVGDIRAGDLVRALSVAIPLLPKARHYRCPFTPDMFGGVE